MSLAEQLFPATLMPDSDWWRALWSNPDGTIRALGITPEMVVVDLCCGDGYFTAAIARQVISGRVIGVDLDPELLGQAKAACSASGNCRWIVGDARELGALVAERVDYVLIANTFHGVPDKAGLAGEVAKILKPGGRFAVVNWHARPREETPVLGLARGPHTHLRMSPADVQAVVEPAGFRFESIVDLAPYHYGAIFVASADELRS